MADTKKASRDTARQGEEARTARARLARSLLLAVGATEEVAKAGADDAADDAHFLDDIVSSLVDDGVVALARLADRRATEADLDRALLGPAFAAALDRRRGTPAGPRERARLARLYSLAGEHEKASSCYREVLDEKGFLPLPFVVEIAQVAARAGERSVALGAIDRIAEVVLTGDAGKEGRVEDVAIAGGALERARDVALELDASAQATEFPGQDIKSGAIARAVALARAAVLLYERSGLKREAARALDGLGRAQVAAGDRPGGRASFERRRALANNQNDGPGGARSLEVAAQAFLETGDAEAAVDRYEQASDAHAQAGDKKAAARAALRAAELRVGRGDLAQAASTLERARAHAASGNDAALETAVRLELARSSIAEGQLGVALRETEAAVYDREQAKDPVAAAAAHVLRAHALLVAGAREEAARELVLAREGATGREAALAIELRAEVALAEDRGAEAHALLADAGRFHALEARKIEGLRTIVRRAEIALQKGELELATGLYGKVANCEAPELVARIALLDAILGADDAARRSALDRAFDLAFATDHALPRVEAGLARAKARMALEKPAVAAPDIRAALEALRDVRKGLPEERRAVFLATAWVKESYAAGKTIRDTLERQRAERKKTSTEDETAGVETALNALDVLLAQLGTS